ncbi:hypothetical protein [uncultured Enterococcus sp.]|uniref:hypothetical protein n=1 Tax=uncultured Enterococcus sp. TaxID=167972 RepID=UPI002AA8DE36|nr:hypothetical protein [uncultured Enterococcus sp.]
MRAWIKINQPIIEVDFRELAEKMWFKTYLDKELELSHGGNSEWLKDSYYLDLKWDKSLNDPRWVQKNFSTEHISLNPIRNKKYLYFETDHVDILSVDKRAFYIMIQILAKVVEGEISEDGMKTWMSLKEFHQKHYELLSMDFDQVNELSLKEDERIHRVDEPWDNEVVYE